MSTHYDSIIIGAGLSGLAAGIRLAHFGKKVCICEKHYRVGGLNSYYTRKNYSLETGLHAMTNFAPKGGNKRLPLLKLLRQLRIPHDSLMLREQNHSLIQFPGATLKFTNEFSMFEASVADQFPADIDNFRKFNELISNYNELSLTDEYVSARAVLKQHLSSQLLREMILAPLLYYGSAVEDDIDFSQFVIMYKSIFMEGFCRPAGRGILEILDLLTNRFEDCGGELKMSCGIESIVAKDGKAAELVTTKGETLTADRILSSAGNLETIGLCDQKSADFETVPRGELGYMETLAIAGDYLDQFDNDFTIMFYSDSEEFIYRKPEGPYCTNSGVVCLPHNFQFEPDDIALDKTVRITTLANHNAWIGRDKAEYAAMKDEATATVLKKAGELTGIVDLQQNSQFIDTITPATINRYTGHINGSIYGSPHKVKDGRTHLDNLFICGTDQGFLGITGAMLSGISMANLHMLQ